MGRQRENVPPLIKEEIAGEEGIQKERLDFSHQEKYQEEG